MEQQPVNPTSNGTATFALVMAILGICLVPFAFFGLIFGLISRSQTMKSGQMGRGTAHAAVVISAVVLGLWAIGIILVVDS
jgi:hypothetical protein